MCPKLTFKVMAVALTLPGGYGPHINLTRPHSACVPIQLELRYAVLGFTENNRTEVLQLCAFAISMKTPISENINCAKADWADLLEGVTIDTAIAVVWICGKGAPSVQVTCKTQSVT